MGDTDEAAAALSDVSMEGGATPSPSGKRPSQSLGLRMKKNIVSRAAQSTLGRKAIGHFLGEEGNKLLGVIKSAVKKDKGDAEAKAVKDVIIKMACKGKVLQDERLIKKKDVWKIVEPLNTAALSFYACVRPVARQEGGTGSEEEAKQPEYKDKPSSSTQLQKVGPEQIAVEALVVRDMTLRLFEEHVSPKNLEKLKEVFDYLCGVAFLEQFMNGEHMAEEKMICFENLRRILKNLIEARNFNDDMQEICKKSADCGEFVVVPYMDFAGSSYCVKHHTEMYKAFCAKPTLAHFTTGPGKNFYPFQEQCKKQVERWIRKFYVSSLKYRAAKPHLRKVFADELWKKYLKSGAQFRVSMDPGILSEIDAKLKTGDEDVFAKAEASCEERMQKFFLDFVKTDDFKEYRDKAHKLPAYSHSKLNKTKSKKGT